MAVGWGYVTPSDTASASSHCPPPALHAASPFHRGEERPAAGLHLACSNADLLKKRAGEAAALPALRYQGRLGASAEPLGAAMTDQTLASTETSPAQWFLRGMRGIVSVPALILIFTFLGFGALARESGLSVYAAALTSASLWASPGQVVLVGSMAAGVGFLGTALAVGLSAVRLLPMTVSLIPVIRAPGTARWKLFFASYFIAVTAWVFSMRTLPSLPREARFPFFAGFGVALWTSGTTTTVLGFLLAGTLPVLLSAALVFLTPIYFLTSLYGAAKLRSDRLALGLGLVLWPVFDWLIPTYALLLSGTVAGTAAFTVHRLTAEPVASIEPTKAEEP